MAMSQATKSSHAAGSSTTATSGFRLGEDQVSEASDSDQSARSRRSISPSGNKTGLSKSKKKKARKQVGALTDELDTLLGAAFQAPEADSHPGINKEVELDEAMQDDTSSPGKKMSKRTRQNMLKAEARKRMREQSKQDQIMDHVPVVEEKAQTTKKAPNQQSQTKKNATHARRQRKEKQRARRAVHGADAMEIG